MPLHALRVLYSATITGGELRNEVDGSTDEARWFPLDELPGAKVGLVDTALARWKAR